MDFNKIYLYRMTHIENIPHVLEYGLTHRTSERANQSFRPIGDASLITSRNRFQLLNGHKLGDYIPFYFGVRMPMLFVIQRGYNSVKVTDAENIVYCVSSVQKIINLQLNFVFTDGHAIDSFSNQYSLKDIAKIDSIIDWNAVKAVFWKDEHDLDKKRRKEAEFLIAQDIPAEGVIGFFVFNDSARMRLIEWGVPENKVIVKAEYYF